MAISYPLALPTVTQIREISFRQINAVAYEQSPFTFAGQAQAGAGQMWGADMTLPPMRRTEAAVWVAWLTSLRGHFGTFTMGDQMGATTLGSAGGAPLVKGASQTGQDLVVDGATVSQTGWLKAGDYIQLGSAATATLHQVLADADSDGSGNVTLTVWPSVRTAPLDNAIVTVVNTVGRWRLAGNETSWSVNEASIYGISFSAIEAIS